jgi:hypothetical protein
MMVDLLNKNLEENLIVKKSNKNQSYRAVLYPYFENQFYYKLGTSIIFGTKVDQEATTIFLPFELLNSLKMVKFQNKLLCHPVKTIVEFETPSYWSWWNNVYSYIIALCIILFINKKSIDFIYLSLIALFGLFFSLVGFYSLHSELDNNYNVLLFNPSLFLFLYFLYKNNKKWIVYIGIFNLISIAIYIGIVAFKAPFLILLPLIIVNIVLISKYVLRNWNRKLSNC